MHYILVHRSLQDVSVIDCQSKTGCTCVNMTSCIIGRCDRFGWICSSHLQG